MDNSENSRDLFLYKNKDDNEVCIEEWEDKFCSEQGMMHDLIKETINILYVDAGVKKPDEYIFANGIGEAYDIYKNLGGGTVQDFFDGILQQQGGKVCWAAFFGEEKVIVIERPTRKNS